MLLKRTSTEAHVYMRRHQGAKCKHFDVSDVIFHKYSHGEASYTVNREKVNVMLEFCILFMRMSVIMRQIFITLQIYKLAHEETLRNIVVFIYYAFGQRKKIIKLVHH